MPKVFPGRETGSHISGMCGEQSGCGCCWWSVGQGLHMSVTRTGACFMKLPLPLALHLVFDKQTPQVGFKPGTTWSQRRGKCRPRSGGIPGPLHTSGVFTKVAVVLAYKQAYCLMISLQAIMKFVVGFRVDAQSFSLPDP